MAILSDTVGQAGIGPAMGFVTMNIALGTVSGPMLGGILYHQLGYSAVFFSAYALVGLDFVLRVLMASDAESPEKDAITASSNERNYGTSSTDQRNQPGETSSSSASSDYSRNSPISSSTASSLSSTLASPTQSTSPNASKVFKTARHPLIILLTNPRMLTALLGDFVQSVILTLLESILPLRIKLLFNYNSQAVALVYLPLSLAPLFGPAFGYASDRLGAKVLVTAGFALSCPFLICLRFVDHDSTEQIALLCVLLLLLGIALNMILTPVYNEATYVIDDLLAADPAVFGGKGAYAQAFGLMNVAYAAGSLAGPLLGGLGVQRVGWSKLMLGLGLACGGLVGLVWRGTGGRRKNGRERDYMEEESDHPS